MPVANTDINRYEAVNRNNDETSTQGGAIDLTTKITGTTIGEVIAPPITSSNPQGGLDRTHLKKYFIHNDNITYSFNGVKVFIRNLLLDIVTTGVVTLTGTSATNIETLTLTGLDQSGNPQQVTHTLNGTTPVVTTEQWSHLQTIETAGDAAISADCVITDHGGLVLGRLPGPSGTLAACHSATAEVQIGFATAKNDTGTVANSLASVPAGVTLSKPNTLATALSIPGDGNLDPGDGIGVWRLHTTKAGLQTRNDIEVAHEYSGTV